MSNSGTLTVIDQILLQNKIHVSESMARGDAYLEINFNNSSYKIIINAKNGLVNDCIHQYENHEIDLDQLLEKLKNFSDYLVFQIEQITSSVSQIQHAYLGSSSKGNLYIHWARDPKVKNLVGIMFDFAIETSNGTETVNDLLEIPIENPGFSILVDEFIKLLTTLRDLSYF